MGTGVTFLDCPAYLDRNRTVRCGLPAVVENRYTLTSTDGPLEAVRIRCPLDHVFNAAIEPLTWEKHPQVTARDQVAPTLPA